MFKIMIVGGGPGQVDIVKKAKTKGLFVVNTSLESNSPAFEFADICEIADVRDEIKNLEVAKKHNINAVITEQCDLAVPTVAYIAEQLGLCGIGTDMAELFTNKYLMRMFCKEHGIDVPDFILCHSKSDVENFLSKHSKIVIKPLSNASSRGVFTIQNKEDIDRYFDTSMGFSKDNTILAEEFMEGIEFTVDGLKTKERHYSLAISQKRQYSKHAGNVATSLLFSKHNSNYDYSQLKSQNDVLVNKTNLKFGLTHAEYKYWNNRFVLIEIAARGGGNFIASKIVPYITGVDNYDLFLSEALEIDNFSCSDLYKLINVNSNMVSLDFFEFMPGRVCEVYGLEELKKMNLIDYNLNFKSGDMIEHVNSDTSRHGYFISSAKTLSELDKKREYIKKIVKIKYQRREESNERITKNANK